MKYLSIIFFVIIGITLFGQELEIKKSEYVIIANNKIITKAKLDEYGNQGFIKSINKGVSKEKRNELAQIFGNIIGEKEFIIIVDLLTEQEKANLETKAKTDNINSTKEKDDGLKLHINNSAENFTVKMINGENITLSDLKGKVVLLNFWATWCAPCLMEFQELPSKIIEPFKNEKFVFIPISRGETEEKVRAKMLELKKKGIDFNVGIDPNKEIWDEYATKYIPKNFLIDINGEIKYISSGYRKGSVDELAKEIKKLLDK